jgi:hypothetical protein
VQDFISRLTSSDLTVVVFFILACIAGITVWVTLQWRLHRRTEIEAALKQEMIRRGMSAEEIERVIRASTVAPAADEEADSKADLRRAAR